MRLKLAMFAVAVAIGSVASIPPAIAAQGENVWVCHITGNARTPFIPLLVSESAVYRHLSHGDEWVGPYAGVPGC